MKRLEPPLMSIHVRSMTAHVELIFIRLVNTYNDNIDLVYYGYIFHHARLSNMRHSLSSMHQISQKSSIFFGKCPIAHRLSSLCSLCRHCAYGLS